eukprot:TRINITY_DN5489_c0_g1_i2.p2 TRINITY_DN5489_c0_g1~~TRINITY_DN5489_c0_g1_i2.p2  ORF type:complete len:118 (+),score=2.44 TRINITY_DN5489_c0_g1_i2:219-572(+)
MKSTLCLISGLLLLSTAIQTQHSLFPEQNTANINSGFDAVPIKGQSNVGTNNTPISYKYQATNLKSEYTMKLEYTDWQLISYADAWQKQTELFNELVKAKLCGESYINHIITPCTLR